MELFELLKVKIVNLGNYSLEFMAFERINWWHYVGN